jgi:hypothetical protein
MKPIPLTKETIRLVQRSWGAGLITIGKIWSEGGDYRQEAIHFLQAHYGFSEGAVLFKPTMASVHPFRQTLEEALSYFIGGESCCPEDLGFALHPWIRVTFRNAGIIRGTNYAMAMGHYFFTGADNKKVKAEYTFGYLVTRQGDIRIHVHHSSLPYSRSI